MSLTRVFTWQFSVRQWLFYPHSASSNLLHNNLALTIAGSDLKNARAQSFVPPKPLDRQTNIFYVASKTGNRYETIQEMILKEEPTISSDSGIVYTGKHI